MSFGTGLLYDILSDIMRSIVDHIGFLISDIYSYAVEINNTAQVSAACTFTMLLGAALCTLAVILQLPGGIYGFIRIAIENAARKRAQKPVAAKKGE